MRLFGNQELRLLCTLLLLAGLFFIFLAALLSLFRVFLKVVFLVKLFLCILVPLFLQLLQLFKLIFFIFQLPLF
jgi:hypothetical protein